jgi:hypothetical protein
VFWDWDWGWDDGSLVLVGEFEYTLICLVNLFAYFIFKWVEGECKDREGTKSCDSLTLGLRA